MSSTCCVHLLCAKSCDAHALPVLPVPAVAAEQIHWFSIFNSFMMVMFLTGLVAIILMRTLRKDFAR